MKIKTYIPFIYQKTVWKIYLPSSIENEVNSHYFFTKDKDIKRFMYNKTQHKDKKHFCMNFLHSFSSSYVLEDDRRVCLEFNCKQGIKTSAKNVSIKFNKHSRQLKSPFKIYAHFESIPTNY